MVTGGVLLYWSLMLSQAMELVTRAFYARADLDLILSSPVASRRVFAVRIAAIARLDHADGDAAGRALHQRRWPGAAARAGWSPMAWCSRSARSRPAVAVALTVVLFRMIGPKRTRLVAQIVAAIVGAAFVIGLQVVAILSYGTSVALRPAALRRWLVASRRTIDSVVWWPARAVLGDVAALVAVLCRRPCAARRWRSPIFSRRFGEHAIAAAGVSAAAVRQRAAAAASARPSPRSALRRKEWTLLRRDPWLISQTLMQLLYLLPPALLLWRNFGERRRRPGAARAGAGDGGGPAGRRPRLARRFRRGRARSGRHRAGLRRVDRARQDRGGDRRVARRVRAVRRWRWPWPRRSTRWSRRPASALSPRPPRRPSIQLWFRTQAKRSQFRRRQTSSRIATFAEAFSSIAWAAAAGMAQHGSWHALTRADRARHPGGCVDVATPAGRAPAIYRAQWRRALAA